MKKAVIFALLAIFLAATPVFAGASSDSGTSAYTDGENFAGSMTPGSFARTDGAASSSLEGNVHAATRFGVAFTKITGDLDVETPEPTAMAFWSPNRAGSVAFNRVSSGVEATTKAGTLGFGSEMYSTLIGEIAGQTGQYTSARSGDYWNNFAMAEQGNVAGYSAELIQERYARTWGPLYRRSSIGLEGSAVVGGLAKTMVLHDSADYGETVAFAANGGMSRIEHHSNCPQGTEMYSDSLLNGFGNVEAKSRAEADGMFGYGIVGAEFSYGSDTNNAMGGGVAWSHSTSRVTNGSSHVSVEAGSIAVSTGGSSSVR